MRKDNSLVDEYGNIHYITDELARGGQGVVYRTRDEDLAIKQPLDSNGIPKNNNGTSELFRRIRTLPLPKDIQISLPLTTLRDTSGYVLKLLSGLKPFSSFYLDGIRRAKMDNIGLSSWLNGLDDKKTAQDFAYYAESGSTRVRLYALYKCAAILARLHNAGIIYGDISANNVFIGETIPYDCFLIDADNMRYELYSSKKGSTVYTPRYGAPEIVQGKDTSRPRTDCWAFAVMAFQSLSLCHPFIGKKVLESEDENAWDVTTEDKNASLDIDEQAYAGLLPFIDDENDDSNEYQGGLPRQLVLTSTICRLFQDTFCVGRTLPYRRPSMALWAIELAKAFDNSIVCPNCGMSYYYIPDIVKCPYCQRSRPPFVVAKTRYWKMNLLPKDDGILETYLPHRLFNCFSLKNGDDSTDYEAYISMKDKIVKPVRGTKGFPSGLKFEFKDSPAKI